MVEPIAGFYILLGLFFDIIGAYLLVSIIVSFKSRWTSDLLKTQADFTSQCEKIIPILSQIEKDYNEKEALKKLQADNKNLLKTGKNFHKKLDKEIKKQQKSFSENRAYSGLSFLIGGFVLQGIGIAFQLF